MWMDRSKCDHESVGFTTWEPAVGVWFDWCHQPQTGIYRCGSECRPSFATFRRKQKSRALSRMLNYPTWSIGCDPCPKTNEVKRIWQLWHVVWFLGPVSYHWLWWVAYTPITMVIVGRWANYWLVDILAKVATRRCINHTWTWYDR